MKILWVSIAIYIAQIITTCQSKIDITLTDISFYGNPEYYTADSNSYVVNKDIKNEVFTRVTLIKTVPNTSMAHFEALVEKDGEYKPLPETDHWLPMCDLIDEPIFFGNFFRKMGFKGCPVEPGVYENPSFVPSSSGDYDYPPGNYMSKFLVEEESKKVICSIDTKVRVN